MAAFHEFLISRFEMGGCSTEDALASATPLIRQVVQTHATGKVAPLDGVAALQVEGVQIWFPESAAKDQVQNLAKIRDLDKPSGVEILAERKRNIDVDFGTETLSNLLIGTREDQLLKPVYLPGYICWEHQVGHHDPLSDVFCLGMILASLACSLDFNQPEDLQRFVANRRNLFRIAPHLNPVVAKAIVSMTELSRHRRPQDLATVSHHLEHYRDQAVDFAFDLAGSQGAGGKKEVVLAKLQERLFEISRRNHLLHFRPTLQAANLTHGSVPLSFDVKNIRPDQVLTWQGEFSRMISAGDAVPLARYLNFTEQIYLPSVLDRIRAEAARDAAEFGFEQLRLAICFLRWANIKETPPEHYDSPLVLLPVRLVKKKGVRDSYWLQPVTTEAQLNPVVRHLFKHLYDIDLPPTIDLSETTLDKLFEDLAAKITASEPGITLNKVDRPRIELIHDLAKRRLDRFRRTARLSGRGIRSFLNIDYSYDPANFHPLGLEIFRARVRQSATRLREIVQDHPAPRQYMVELPGDVPVAEKSRQFFTMRDEADDNPYHWDFDLCRLTLGNFRYRKMTLVRDYAELRSTNPPSPVFDFIFSLTARPVEPEIGKPPALEDRFHVVSCDPTQAAAIGLARTGVSYIIQGPPGTGKSQTITNLIADYVIHGKRVLFVCAKRAAIDVVYSRLRQQGLHQLCCLIHDSQSDKKEFILDLKSTYEGLLTEQQGKPQQWRRRRENVLKSLRQELEPLEQFDQSMLSIPGFAGVTVRQLLERAIELSAFLPTLSPVEKEMLPDYAQWTAHAEAVDRLVSAVGDVQKDAVFARHPLHLLKPSVAQHERPIQLIGSSLRTAQGLLDAAVAALKASNAPDNLWESLADVLAMQEYAAHVEPLAKNHLLPLLDANSPMSGRFADFLQKQHSARDALTQAQEAIKNWISKLAPDETVITLDQAQALEAGSFSFLKPAWWRLRKVLNAQYRFAAHAVKPRWSQVLLALDNEYKAGAALAQIEQATRADVGAGESIDEIARHVQQARACMQGSSPRLKSLNELLLKSAGASIVVASLLEAGVLARELHSTCDLIIEEFEDKTFSQLKDLLDSIEKSLGVLPNFLHCLGRLAQLPPKLASAFRSLPLNARGIEAGIIARGLDELFLTDRVLNNFNGAIRAGHVQRLASLSRRWREANAAAVLEKARQVFLEHVRITSESAAGQLPQQKEFKAQYNRGRRQLEHEFGKVMRHKSIRDILAGDSGLVVNDLKPVWLMSPLSVSDTLPLCADDCDVVIFDEASQVPLEEAVPSIFRARQTIVVGDEMQLPPTDFFSAKSSDGDEEGLQLSEDGQVFEYDLSSNSFLNHAAKNLPSRMLGWHYRSRSESLISFSNWAFYQGKLLTVPEQRQSARDNDEFLIQSPEEGAANAGRLLERPVSFHFMAKGIYDNRRNRIEADYVAELVRALLCRQDCPTIGIVAFSEAQQGEIEGALVRLAETDKAFADRLDAEYEREVDGQFAGLLIKNLENIQGDERDLIILSVCYGHAPDGKMRMNFGPINQRGGEKRLNVAFSRAKRHMVVVSSIRHADITNDYNEGANCLKSYLQYAAACSAGDTIASHRVLHGLAVWQDLAPGAEPSQAAIVRQIAQAMTQRGYAVDLGVGMSSFRCDIAARRHGEKQYRLGVLVDTDAHYRNEDLLEREMLRPQLLRDFGWTIAHVLARDWYVDRVAVLDHLIELIEHRQEPPKPDSDVADDESAWAELDEPEESEEAADGALDIESPNDELNPETGDLDLAVAPSAFPSVPAAVQPGPFKRYFEFAEGSSRKFWEIALSGDTVTVRFGRIGTHGQTQPKVFADDAMAAQTARRLIAQKLAKGYQEQKSAGE